MHKCRKRAHTGCLHFCTILETGKRNAQMLVEKWCKLPAELYTLEREREETGEGHTHTMRARARLDR